MVLNVSMLQVKNINDLNSAQSSVIKHVCGRSKRARHSALMQALDVTGAADYVKKSTISLYDRTCAINSHTRDLCIYFVTCSCQKMSEYPAHL